MRSRYSLGLLDKKTHYILVQSLPLRMTLMATSRLISSHSDLKPRTNKYILELWQSEWDEFPENKLYKIFPVLKECISCPQKNRKKKL